MPGNVLVAYGTTNGSTAQIAEAVAEVLRMEGLTATALPAEEYGRYLARAEPLQSWNELIT